MSFVTVRVRAVLAGLLLLSAYVWAGEAAADTNMDEALSAPAALGTEIVVDPVSSFITPIPTIAEIDGGFVVVWTEVEGAPADDFDRTTRVFAQRYSDAGAAMGGQIDVATLQGTTNRVNVISSQGGFIITGVATKPPVPPATTGGARDYLAVRYDAAGALDTSFNLGRSGQTAPLADGGFVMVWRTDETAAGRLRFQIHDSAGNPVGSESSDIEAAVPSQINAQWDVAGLADGSFVIAYPSAGADDIYWTRYNPSGRVATAPQRVNDATAGVQHEPVVTGLSQGGFAIAWTDGGTVSTPAWAIRLQAFTPAGTETGSEVLAANGADADEAGPRLSPLQDGHFALVWNDEQNFIQIHGATGTLRDAPVRLNATDGALPGNSAALNGTTTAAAWTGDGSIRARTYVTETGIPDTLAPGSGILVNTATTNDQELSNVAALAGGGFVVVWADFSQRDVGSQVSEIKAQRFAADGSALGPEFQVNTTLFGRQDSPDVAGLTDGGFVIVWRDKSNTGADTDSGAVRARRYDASGVAQGGEFLVNTTTQGEQDQPVVAGLNDGGFVVAWADDIIWGSPQYLGSENIFAQRFDSSGAPAGPELNVSGADTLNTDPEIAALADGGFAITWINDWDRRDIDSSGGALHFRLYSAAGTPGTVVPVTGCCNIQEPSITALNDGRFALSYTRYLRTFSGAGSADQVFAQVFEANGNQVTDAFLVAGELDYEIRASQSEVRPLPGGQWALVWMSAPRDTPDHVRFQRYQPDGTTFGDPITVNPASPDVDTAPHLAPLAGGGLVTVWDDDSGNYGDLDGEAVIAALIGGNSPPVADNDAIALVENAAPVNVAATLLAGDTDPDPGETAGLTITSSYGLGFVTTNSGATSVSATDVDFLAQGETTAGYFGYVVSDTRGATDSALVTATISGINDTPGASDIFGALPEDSIPADVTDFALATVIDPDTSDTHTVSGFNTTGTRGRVTLEGGRLLYDPRGNFPDLDDGDTYEDSFSYTVSDPFGGTASATVHMTISGVSNLVSARTSGLGNGQVTSAPGGITCGNGGTDCTEVFAPDSSVTLTPTPAAGSAFGGWSTGPCAGQTGPCTFTMGGDVTATARFTLEMVPDGRIVAATLPGARSGYVGGPVLTAYMSVVSRATTPAQSCTISAPGTPPFTFAYQALDGSNQPAGPVNPVFDLANGETMSFVLSMTPQTVTGPNGYLFQPQIACGNADLAPIEGVNSILVVIDNTSGPDILSIAVTPSGDGVIRIPATGNRVGIMSAAAVNIGDGDGSYNSNNEARVYIAADTGEADLPVTIEVCPTTSSGACGGARFQDPFNMLFVRNEPQYFAVFVRANPGAVLPFDPANARVFLRFASGNSFRSVTSAAVTSPAPTDRPETALAGRWSVLVRQDSGDWPSLARGALHVLGDGRAVLSSGDMARLIDVSAGPGPDGTMIFTTGGSAGVASNTGTIRLGDPLSDQPGAFWGIRDARSGEAPEWADLSGRYGSVVVADDGAISGTLDGCTVTGNATRTPDGAPGLRTASLTLSVCGERGQYTVLLDPAANDNSAAGLIVANESRGWRIER